MARFKVISGGQVGVDRVALDAALDLGIEIGGFVSAERKAEDGRVPDKYTGMVELDSPGYSERTRRNVETADATLILIPKVGHSSPGTNLTIGLCGRLGKPGLIQALGVDNSQCVAWCNDLIKDGWVLNCAGPRVINLDKTYRFFVSLFEELKAS